MEVLFGKHWHCLPDEETLDILETNRDRGLDLFEVKHRQERMGPNVIRGKKEKSQMERFLLQFHQPLIYILIVAGVVTAILHEWVDSGVIFAVIILNAIIGFLQESKAIKAIEALARTMTAEATVLRSGEKHRIPSPEIVPGDIIFLQSGDKVPADLRLFQCRELQVDESVLTGESVPARKKIGVLPRDTVLADRLNMAYASTLVTYGQAAGVVVGTGNRTEVGRISELIAATDVLETPLTRKIARFSHLLLYVILGLSGLTFIVGLLQGFAVGEVFMAAVSLAVATIPEGLPAVLTITLGIGVSRMAKRRAVIRKLPAVETLGSTTVICSDKTGTLTENQMTVQEIFAGGERFEVSGVGYQPKGVITVQNRSEERGETPALRECLQAGLLCNDSLLKEKEGRWGIQGDPTEGALLVAAGKGGISIAESNQRYPRLDAIPFESHHQYMATLHYQENEATLPIYLKGAVEVILAKCTSTMDSSGRHMELDPATVTGEMDRMAAKGLRVLAFARGEGQSGQEHLDHEDVASGLTFLGLQGMIDPPREEAVAAVKSCHEAGIRVKMITGDHAATASAIAKQMGLFASVGGKLIETAAVTGKTLSTVSDEKLIELADRSAVFARVSPEQKLRLVEAIQARGNVVAMTGDGVNDAPALKKADIGVAMGITGTDVAKEAADMVLTDDNFATIEAAVEEGRGVFDNLTKFIVWILPTNVGQGAVILVAVAAGVTLPILPVQILWLNMVTAVLLGLMLAFEPKEPGIMQRPPRDPKTPLLTRELMGRILIVGGLLVAGSFGLFEWELIAGHSKETARTVAVNVFVMVQTFYLFKCRSLTRPVLQIGLFSNVWVWVGVVSMLILQLFFTYLPGMNWIFHTAPISAGAWARIILVAVIVYAAVSFEKLFWRKKISRARVD